MRYLLSLLALAACLTLTSVSAADPAPAEKVKELKEKCAKGDQHACTELEFLSD